MDRVILAGWMCIVTCGLSAFGDTITWSVENFDFWGYGNHRAKVLVDEPAAAVRVHIPWRRRDLNPASKDIRVYYSDPQSSALQQVTNVVRINVLNEYGDIAFEAKSAGEYYVYYLPYTPNTSCFVPVVYDDITITCDPQWAAAHHLDSKSIKDDAWKQLPRAKLIEIQARPCRGVDGAGIPVNSYAPQEVQARHDFHRFDPMEIVATDEEVRTLTQEYSDEYLIFVENRDHQIKMFDYLPLRWIEDGPCTRLDERCQPGEYYPFQVGIFAAQNDIENISLTYTDLKNDSNHVIPSSAFTCINLRGRDITGEWFSKQLSVKKNYVQPLWVCIDVPEDASGTYTGTITVNADNVAPRTVEVTVHVDGPILKDHGDDNVRRLSRLHWLDSDMGLDDTVVDPYTPVNVHDDTIKILNRQITLNGLAMPISIISNNIEILNKPAELIVSTIKGQEKWQDMQSTKVSATEARACFAGQAKSGMFSVKSSTRIEYDGCIDLACTITANRDCDVSDIGIRLYLNRDVATYMMGFGRRGGTREKEIGWQWDINRATNMFWMGIPDAGMQLKLCHEIDNLFVSDYKKVGLPTNWYNNGKGGAVVYEEGDDVVLRAYTGNRRMNAGQSLQFKYRLLVTPFKPLDKKHWNRRQGSEGGNICFAFQGAANNPYINYPFLNPEYLTKYNNEQLAKGLRSLVYYTTGQVSGYMAELYPFRSLGDEIFAGEVLTYYEDKAILNEGGGGFPWLQEHLVYGYSMGWKQPLPGGETDFALGITQVPNRQWNYYVEGVDWLARHCDIHGLYLDGIGCNRVIMQRVKNVLSKSNPDAILMNHGGNNYDWLDRRLSTANYCMEHFPYMDLLWYGEGYDYNRPPDYWLVEISGMPFGVGSSMLEYNTGGNQWRGMLYGMTGAGNKATPGIWKLWDEFGIADAEMIGYWSDNCPVRTDNPHILATVYKKKGQSLVAIASWCGTTNIQLSIDYGALGINSSTAMLTAPAITAFQNSARFKPHDPIPVEAGKGWLLYLK